MNNKRPSLEDLIWKGSLLPNKYKFAIRNDVRSELQQLDERWSKAKKTINERVDHMTILYSDWCKCDSTLASLNDWVNEKMAIVKNEQKLEFRSGVHLKNFLESYKVKCVFFLSLCFQW